MPRETQGWIEHETKEITFYIIFGIIMGVLLPIFLGFVLKGFEESFIAGRPLQFGDFLVTYIIYYIMIFAGLIGLPVLKYREMILTKRGENVARQKNPSIFSVAYLHDPEVDGLIYNLFSYAGLKGKRNWMRWSLPMWRMFIIGSLIFSLVAMSQIFTGTQFTGIPNIPFQVTTTMKVLFTAEPPAFAETTLMIFVLSLLMGLNSYIVSKFKIPTFVYWIVAIMLICPLIGLSWMGFHNIVYGNSEVSLFATFLFGWIGSTITVLFGTFILWYAWHFWNNVFAKINELLPQNEDVIFISILIWVIVFVAYIGIELLLRKFKSKDTEITGEPTSF
jgi:hypothetical protein